MPLLQKTKSSYQPIKDKDGNVMLTSEQARNIDEDHHEFDHKPGESNTARIANSKMKKMKKEAQGRKAVKDVNKVISNISPFKMKYQSPLNFKGANSKNSKCWDGYKKVGTKKSPSGTGETVNDCVKE